jgi:hypothetical protein
MAVGRLTGTAVDLGFLVGAGEGSGRRESDPHDQLGRSVMAALPLLRPSHLLGTTPAPNAMVRSRVSKDLPKLPGHRHSGG